MSTITVVIPTYNEEKNIAECIISCRDIADRILLLDNMSTDQTKEIAESLGAEVFQTERSYKERMAMLGGEIPIDTDWILYMDADERLTRICKGAQGPVRRTRGRRRKRYCVQVQAEVSRKGP